MARFRPAVLLGMAALIVPACGGGGGGGAASPPAGNAPPGVVLIRPAAGASFAAGDPIVIEADVSDDGWVMRVGLFRGSTLLATVDAVPFRFTWTDAAAGSYSLAAVATDNLGAQTTSLPVSIIVTGGGGPVNRPPSVTLTSPPHGSSFPDGYPATVEAEASDPEGALASVEFLDGTRSLGTVTTPPYRVAWTATPPGSHSLRAVATDASGGATSSAPATVTVTSSGVPPPPPTIQPQGELQGVFFANESTGWIVGEAGRIYKTTDGGVTWIAQVSGTTSWLKRVQFVSTTRGWIAGGGGTILSTSDGGTTWSRQSSGTTEHLQGLSFINATTGWAVGESSTLLKTTDGGATWVHLFPSEWGHSFDTVSFVDALYGWIGGSGFVDSTSDGGATWTRQPMYIPSNTDPYLIYFHDSRFMSRTTGTLVGVARSGHQILTTTDGGATWTRTQRQVATGPLSGVAFGDDRHLWAVGSEGSIVVSTDGGAAWTVLFGGT